MTPDEADRVVKIISAAWGYFADDTTGRVALWTEHLDRLDFEPTRTAARKLAETSDQLPPLATFLRAVQHEERMARLALSARPDDRPACAQCDGTGWARAAVAGSAFAVVACRCSAGPADDGREHPPSCTCRRCAYGERRARDIANGVDGLSRSGPDTLRP